ncbi:hypothetical protein CPB84DRAFT_1006611 [Gymnopilus junonius]|uniref:F-box domain-containing protein n=1 Tax=Gymnopilus junonius TaxID=109634 RepID=A0A9P5NPK1_GYMJU|nr:hypothetical protein CPB84DRAFT_1006611 [Gymnopilus junonius]
MNSKQTDVFLPVEILQDCFGYLRIQDRKNLSLACNLFRSICLPSLFESVSYSLSISETTIRSRRQTQLGKAKDEIQRFKSIAESSIHAPLIRKCVMSDILMLDRGSSIDDEVATAYASFTRAFAECVPYFINMKEVNMENFNAKIDKKVLAALASLTLLEKVIFRPIGFFFFFFFE